MIPHLLKIKIKEDFRCLKKDTEIELKSLTLLVGEQGCGKSSLLTLLQESDVDATLSKFVQVHGINTYYFDSEKMNPRINDLDEFTNPNGTSKGIGIGGAMAARFQSHGEVLREFTVNRIKEAKNCVLFFDEPESSLSLKNQYRLAKEFKQAEKRNVQIVLATHCLPLIESVEKVFWMETMEWVDSKEFIQSQKI